MSPGIVRRAFEILRNEGPLTLLFRVLGETVYRRMLVMETDLTRHVFEPDARCRWLRVDEAVAYARSHDALTETEVRRRYGEGQRCWALTLPDGSLAYSVWASVGRAWVEYLAVNLPLRATEAYVYQAFTTPAHRGNRFATIGVRALKHALTAEGVLSTCSCLQPDRAIGYPPAFRSGLHPCAYIGWIRLGPWRWTFRRATDHLPFYAPKPRADATGAT